MERHPEAFQDAMAYEKTAVDHGSPFTWTQGESLAELARPERVAQIKADYEKRKARQLKRVPINPLRQGLCHFDIDDLYDADEGNGACSICTK